MSYLPSCAECQRTLTFLQQQDASDFRRQVDWSVQGSHVCFVGCGSCEVVVAFAALGISDGRLHILSIQTSADCLRSGLGRSLVASLVQEHHPHRLYARVGLDRSARPFWEGIGWHLVEEETADMMALFASPTLHDA